MSYPNTTNIFLFGVPGSGKTCFLAALFKYLQYNYSEIDFCLKDNPVGAEYALELMDTVSNGDLPPFSMVELDNPVDISLKAREKRMRLRFIDLAGEWMNFKNNEEQKTVLTDSAQKIVKEKLDKYIRNKTDTTIMAFFFDPENKISLEVQDDNYWALNQYLDEIDNKRISKQRVIILTKFDTLKRSNSGETSEDILRKFVGTKLQTMGMHIRESSNPKRVMGFSIGEVDKEEQKITKLDLGGGKVFMNYILDIVSQRQLSPLKVVILPTLFLASTVLYFYDLLSVQIILTEIVVGLIGHFAIDRLITTK